MAKAAPATRDRPTVPTDAPGTAALVGVDDEAVPVEVPVPEALVPDPDAVPMLEPDPEALPVLVPDPDAVPVLEPEAVPVVVVVVNPDGVLPPETETTPVVVLPLPDVAVVVLATTTGVVSPAGIEAAPACEVTTAG